MLRILEEVFAVLCCLHKLSTSLLVIDKLALLIF
uniref:Uncharacterized protein n=1 Tax=Arundo donax TaxID=35708 RepID=A0A0A9AFU4_ARUDO